MNFRSRFLVLALLLGLPLPVRAGAPTTTTTTVPSSCQSEATFESIDCRLDLLVGALDAAQDLGKQQNRLSKNAKAARTRKEKAEQLGTGRKARGQLRVAVRKMLVVRRDLRSNKARKSIPQSTRETLLDMANPIFADLKTLRGTIPKK